MKPKAVPIREGLRTMFPKAINIIYNRYNHDVLCRHIEGDTMVHMHEYASQYGTFYAGQCAYCGTVHYHSEQDEMVVE
jgi:hypothetical protein